MEPLKNTTFSIKVNFKEDGSQIKSEDDTVLCLKHSDFSFDSYAVDAYYICSAEAAHEILNVESYNNYDFKDSEGNTVDYSSSLQVIKASKNLNEETQPLREFVYFENAEFSKGSNSLTIKGKLKGDKKDEVAKQDKLIMTFYEEKEEIPNVQNYTINALNSSCQVKNHNPDNFEIECSPQRFNINGTQQFLINGTTIVSDSETKNIEIYLNTTKESDAFSYYTEPKEESTKRGANANIIGYNNYKPRRNPNPPNPLRPVVIEFTLFLKFTQISPLGKITFTMRITYKSIQYVLRRLQEKQTEENTTAVCELESENDDSTGIASYKCSAETTDVPDEAESLNNFEFFDKNGEPVLIDAEDINFSKDALEGGKNITLQNSSYAIVYFDNAKFIKENENDTSSFLVKGFLTGGERNTVAGQDSLIITFYDVINGESFAYNTMCEVINHDPNDFSIKCSPENNVTGKEQYLTNGTTPDDKVKIYLNTSKETDNFSFLKYGKKTKNSNIVWRKTSSGLSGGAIAGIVIACAVTLILITILLMFMRRAKKETNNNSTIVGLKSVDYYNE